MVVLALIGSMQKPARADEASPLETKLERNEPLTPPRYGWYYGSEPKVTWLPEYRKFSWVDGVLAGGVFATGIAWTILGPPRQAGQTAGGFDEEIRDTLLSSSYRNQLVARDVSDVLLGLSLAYSLVGDPLVNATWLRRSPEVGGQVLLINLQVAATNLGLQQLAANAIGRERPYGRTCGTDFLNELTFDCEGDDRYRSHYSGHASTAFALAAATCTHHMYLGLVGDNAALSCTGGFLLATTTAALRIAGDRHYATDVLVGAAVGLALGFGIPLLHYEVRSNPLASKVAGAPIALVPGPLSLSLVGVMP